MLKGFWGEWKDASLWYKLKQLRWELRYAFRRAWEGHDDIDVINFQHRFTERMINILKSYRDYTYSYGGIFHTMEDKYKAIDEMILAFQEMQIDEDDKERKDKALELLKQYFDYI